MKYANNYDVLFWCILSITDITFFANMTICDTFGDQDQACIVDSQNIKLNINF